MYILYSHAMRNKYIDWAYQSQLYSLNYRATVYVAVDETKLLLILKSLNISDFIELWNLEFALIDVLLIVCIIFKPCIHFADFIYLHIFEYNKGTIVLCNYIFFISGSLTKSFVRSSYKVICYAPIINLFIIPG